MTYVYNAILVSCTSSVSPASSAASSCRWAPQPRGITNAMFHGALTQLVTGVLMVGMREGKLLEDEDELNMTKISIKLVIALVVYVVCWLGRRKPAGEQQPYWALAGGLAIVNVVVAVFV